MCEDANQGGWPGFPFPRAGQDRTRAFPAGRAPSPTEAGKEIPAQSRVHSNWRPSWCLCAQPAAARRSCETADGRAGAHERCCGFLASAMGRGAGGEKKVLVAGFSVQLQGEVRDVGAPTQPGCQQDRKVDLTLMLVV